MDSDYPRGTCENEVYHFHVTIQTIITSYLRPVFCDNIDPDWLTPEHIYYFYLVSDFVMFIQVSRQPSYGHDEEVGECH